MYVLKLCPHSLDIAVTALEQAGMSKPGRTGQHEQLPKSNCMPCAANAFLAAASCTKQG